MKKTSAVLVVSAVLAVSLLAGCGGGGTPDQSSIQGLLDLQCQKMMSSDVDGYINTFTISVKNPELMNFSRIAVNLTFSMAKFKSCSLKATNIKETGNTATADVERSWELEVFGQTQKVPTTTKARTFEKINGKWYDRGDTSTGMG